MNCLNGEEYLREAIESVYAQTYTNWEIIFWDNASTDNTATIAQSYDSKIKYFRSDETLPLGAARNLAIEKSRGQLLAFLDCDDVWLPRKLEKQIDYFVANPDIGFIYTNYYKLIQGDSQSMRPAYKEVQPEGLVFSKFIYNYDVLISSVILKKEALFSLNDFFDDRLNQLEEYDVFMRILYHRKAGYIADLLAIYRFHDKQITEDAHIHSPNEYPIIFEKFKKTIKDFEKDNPNICNHFKIQLILYSKVKLKILQGKSRHAQKIIAPHKYYSLKIFGLYCATLLPVSWSIRLYRWLLHRSRKS